MNINKVLVTFIRVAFGIILILMVIYGATKLCAVGYDFGYRVFTEAPVDKAPGKDVLVQVKDDMSGRDIGKLLEEKGLVRDGNLFYIQLKLSAYSKKIVPDVYTLNTSMTPKEMMVVMSAMKEETQTTEIKESDEGTTEPADIDEDEVEKE